MKKVVLYLMLALSLVLLTSACGKKEEVMTDEDAVVNDTTMVEIEEEPPVVERNEKPEEPAEPEEPEIIDTIPEGMALSPFTGLYVPEATATKRPYAVMINNLAKALPQSGISQAEIIFETLAEGGITRLLAIFQSFNTDKIGPVRSARDYYIDFATDMNAIFVHHGGSPQAYDRLSKSKYNNMDGIKLDGSTFQRDPVRVKQKGMYEHSSYTAAERLKSRAEAYDYPLEISESFSFGFAVNPSNESMAEGIPAENVLLAFSSIQKSAFQYNPETKQYARSQNNKAHVDENTGEQLTTKNIIIQITKISLIPKDPEGRLAVNLVSSGKGYYITEGKAYPLTWSKESATAATRYKKADGELLQIMPGNSWICVFPDNEKIYLNDEVVE